MIFTPIELCHKPLIDGYLAKQRIDSSELTFLTFYIWRKVFNVRFAEHEGCLIVEFRDNGYPPSLRFPLGGGDKKEAVRAVCEYYRANGKELRFYGLTADMAKELSGFFPGRFEISAMTDYYDYVYETERLISLAGKPLHTKRNHVNKFKKSYTYRYEQITSADAEEILEKYDAWLAGRETEKDYYLDGERLSIADILHNFESLGCSGAKLYADGNLCAFTIGEQLNGDTALIHIEKADIAYDGAYAAINQMFAENRWAGFKYINREDDFGIEGLRKAKLSYRPAFMVEKYKAIEAVTEG